MTTPAGWYPDAQAPHLNRWWDGGQWTSHTAVRAGQQFFAVYPAANSSWVKAPPRPKPRGPKILAIVGITALAGYLGLVAVFSLAGRTHSTGVDGPPTCGLVMTSQMSPTTLAFVRVLIAKNAQSAALTKTLHSEAQATVADVQTKINEERQFADSLTTIPFTGQAALDANRLSAQRQQLAADLALTIDQPQSADLVARIRGEDYDPEPYETLRTDMDLPAKGTCTFTAFY